jgi:F-box and leucine-rich repeat protein 14
MTTSKEIELNVRNKGPTCVLLHLTGITCLQHIDLSQCRSVTDTSVAYLSGLTALQHLDLSECDYVTDSGVANLSGLTALQHLELTRRWRVTDNGRCSSKRPHRAAAPQPE